MGPSGSHYIIGPLQKASGPRKKEKTAMSHFWDTHHKAFDISDIVASQQYPRFCGARTAGGKNLPEYAEQEAELKRLERRGGRLRCMTRSMYGARRVLRRPLFFALLCTLPLCDGHSGVGLPPPPHLGGFPAAVSATLWRGLPPHPGCTAAPGSASLRRRALLPRVAPTSPPPAAWCSRMAAWSAVRGGGTSIAEPPTAGYGPGRSRCRRPPAPARR